eukprot:GFUD01040781.1.p2 GENE.GFUD01040781.1~~GFUD01040781.1.p2  ORF type:complete len:110 (-),score=35.23 GFUD01040781.1:734-1033(-)
MLLKCEKILKGGRHSKDILAKKTSDKETSEKVAGAESYTIEVNNNTEHVALIGRNQKTAQHRVTFSQDWAKEIEPHEYAVEEEEIEHEYAVEERRQQRS